MVKYILTPEEREKISAKKQKSSPPPSPKWISGYAPPAQGGQQRHIIVAMLR
jgi:hypothetical protein